MNDRNRTAPVPLARNTPVPQAIVHLSLRDRPIAARAFFQAFRDLLLGLVDRHAIEKPRIDHAAVAVICDVGDHKCFRILARRTNHRRVAESIFVDEIEIALVVRRAAENRTGAVIHQNEVGDIDRQFPVCIEWMHRFDAGIEAEFFGGVDFRLRGAHAVALLDEFGELGIFYCGGLRERMVRRQRHELGAEQSVRACRENFQLAFFVGRR